MIDRSDPARHSWGRLSFGQVLVLVLLFGGVTVFTAISKTGDYKAVRSYRLQARIATQTVLSVPVGRPFEIVVRCLKRPPLGGMTWRGPVRLDEGRRALFSQARNTIVVFEEDGVATTASFRISPGQALAPSTRAAVERCLVG